MALCLRGQAWQWLPNIALLGAKNGLATAWAHALGIGLYALFTILGLAILLHQFPLVFKIITYAGAAYLAWLGVNAIQSKVASRSV